MLSLALSGLLFSCEGSFKVEYQGFVRILQRWRRVGASKTIKVYYTYKNQRNESLFKYFFISSFGGLLCESRHFAIIFLLLSIVQFRLSHIRNSDIQNILKIKQKDFLSRSYFFVVRIVDFFSVPVFLFLVKLLFHFFLFRA